MGRERYDQLTALIVDLEKKIEAVKRPAEQEKRQMTEEERTKLTELVKGRN